MHHPINRKLPATCLMPYCPQLKASKESELQQMEALVKEREKKLLTEAALKHDDMQVRPEGHCEGFCWCEQGTG